MTKRKITKKDNKALTYTPHYYSWGGDFKATIGDSLNLKNVFSGGNVAGMLAGIGSTVGSVAGNTIGGGLSSGAGDTIGKVRNIVGGTLGTVNPLLGGIVSAGTGIIGGLTNRMFGSKLNEGNISEIEGSNKRINTLLVDSSSLDSIASQWGNTDFGSDFTMSDVGKDGWFSNKAKKKYRALKTQQEASRNRALAAFDDAIDAVNTDTNLNALANYAALGGQLNVFSDGGNIHIKPSKRGTFTAAAKKHGKSVQEFASQVLANKDDYSSAMVKKANFARNASKWHSFGGELNTNGGDFTNGQTVIGNGDTHENNPMEGVLMGIDSEGVPNLVEQGEVVFNDYVFSNRLIADKELLKTVNLPTTYANKSFASIAKKLGEESKERPNDPISKRGLTSAMNKLQQAQEIIRQNTQMEQEGTQYAHGGKMGTLFDGFGPKGNYLRHADFFFTPSDVNYGYTPIPSYVEDPYVNKAGVPKFGAGITPAGEYIETPKNMARAKAKRMGYNVGSSLGEYLEKPMENPTKDNTNSFNLTSLRYAPVLGAAIGLGQNLFSKPDYSSANAILEAANQTGNYIPISYNPISNYLQYRPFDRNYYLNKLDAQAGATRRAIMNTSSPSRNAALLAADYNAQTKAGELARQAEEYNLAQRQAVEQFNRGTNQTNTELGLKAAMANQEAAMKARNFKLSGIAQAMAIKDAVDSRRGASLSANLSNLFESLGNIGIDAYNRADRDMLLKAGVFGTLSEKPQEWSDKTWKEYKKYINNILNKKGK